MALSYKVALGALVLVGLWLLSGLLFPPDGTPEERDAAQATGVDLETVLAVEKLRSQPHQRKVVLYGATAPYRRVALKAETQGTVKAIPAAEGGILEQGDVIVEIDVRNRRAQLARAKALLKQREIEYNAAQKLQAQGFQTEIRLAEAKTNLEEARVTLHEIELDLQYTKLRAPFDGILENVNVEIGDFVGVGVFGGEGDLATVVDPSPLLIVGQISERDRAHIAKGEKAIGHIREINRDVTGEVTYLSSVADTESRTFRVEVSIPNPDYVMPAGLTTELEIPAETVDAYFVSPSVLALDDEGEVGVKVLDADNIVRFRPVEIVEDTKEGMWIAGLPPEITLITLGQAFVSAGQQLDAAMVARVTKADGTQADQDG